jgi:hypothetical protein
MHNHNRTTSSLLLQRICSFNKYLTAQGLLVLFVFEILSAQSSTTIYVGRGWNLLSLPAKVTNGNKSYLFPSSVTSAFVYNPQSGYTAEDTLENGKGFWLKFAEADSIQVDGSASFKDSIGVQTGWNLLGSIAVPIAASDIRTVPEGIISSQFYGYVPGGGYQQADTLYPGFGYWIKVNQDGAIIPLWEGAVLGDSTKQPESLPNFISATVDSNQLTLTYQSSDDLPTLVPGDILVGNSDGGYARKVLSTSMNENQLIVETEMASFDEALNIGNVDTSYDIEFPDEQTLKKILAKPLRSQGSVGGKAYLITASTPLVTVSPNARLLTLKFPNFKLEIESVDSNWSVSVEADTMTFTLEATIKSFVFEFYFGLQACRFTTELKPSITFDHTQILVNGTWETTDSLPLIPNPILLGIIPTPVPGLVLTPEFNLFAGLTPSFTISAGVETDGNVEIGGTLETGFDYSDGALHPVWNASVDGTVESAFYPSGSIEGELKMFLKPSIDCRINGTVGIGIFVKPYQYNKISYPPLAAEIGGGVSGGVSASLRLFSLNLFNYELTLADYRWIWWSTHGPNEPSNPNPQDRTTGVCTSLTLSWSCSDPDGDSITYDVYFGTDNPPTTKVSSEQSDTSLSRAGLIAGITYYWYVVAKDIDSNTTSGPIWSFTTNQAPSLPTNPTPEDSASGLTTSLTLSWSYSNYDNEILFYDVYLDTVNPPLAIISYNQKDTSLFISGLESITTYYWKILVKNCSDSTIGPVWKFTTSSYSLNGRNIHGIAYDSGFLWIIHSPDTNGNFAKISKLNPDDGQILLESSQFQCNGRGITIGNGALWITDALADRIRKIDPSNFNELASFSTPGTEPNGIAFDGTYFWLTDPYYQKIYQLNYTGGIVSRFNIPNAFRNGLEWENGGMWTNTDTTSVSYYTTDGMITSTKTFTNLPSGTYVYDIAIGNSKVYISAGNKIYIRNW